MEEKQNGGVIAFIIIIIIVLFVGFLVSNKGTTSNGQSSESKAFERQMKKDPSTWTKREKDRYDSFIKWDMQNEKK